MVSRSLMCAATVLLLCGTVRAQTCDDNSDCPNNRYCHTTPGNCDGNGKCRKKPNACPQIFDPVCGCDGVTYSNACHAAMAGVSVDHEGECEEICGGFLGIPCDDPDEFCKLNIGECCCDFQGVCTVMPDACPDVFDPVCGCDGVTYGNECEADAAGVSIDHLGPCSSGGAVCGGILGTPCENPNEFCKLNVGECCCDFQGVCTPFPMACPLVFDPVCGCDGMTYTNSCFADAAGVSIDHLGACEGEGCLSNADCFSFGLFGEYCSKAPGDCDGVGECVPAPQLCLDVWDPVCGCDGNIYSNSCYAARSGVNVASEGACGF